MQGSIARKSAVCQTSVIFLLVSLLGLPAWGQELTKPLSAEEVACNERQLERLLLRMNAAKEFYTTPQLPTTLLVAPGSSAGSYEGLLATFQDFRLSPGELPPVEEYEHYLVFNINSSTRTLSLNPDQRLLPIISLKRETSNSNLVPPGGYFDLTLKLEPVPNDGSPVVINNLEESQVGEPYNGFIASSTKVDRRLISSGLLASCHNKFTTFDLHIFSVLRRIVRTEGMAEFFMPDMEVAIFRGEDRHTYRLNFYPIYEGLDARGRMSAEMRIKWSDTGRLTTARIKIFPACASAGQLRCSNLRQSDLAIFFIPPVFGGQEFFSSDAVEGGGFYLWDEGPSEPRTINLKKLLEGTTWNEPSW